MDANNVSPVLDHTATVRIETEEIVWEPSRVNIVVTGDEQPSGQVVYVTSEGNVSRQAFRQKVLRAFGNQCNQPRGTDRVEISNKREEWIEKVLHAHIPTYFKIKTLNASSGRIFEPSLPKTIRYSYNALGYDLGSCVFQHTDEEAFDQLLDVWDDEIKTAKWLRRHMNHFFRLIPSRKRSLFVEGFQEGFEERGCLG